MKAIVFLALGLVCADPALAVPYSFQLVQGITGSTAQITVQLHARALNNNGQVLGTFTYPNGPTVTAVYDSLSSVRQIDSSATQYLGFNDAGQLSGSSRGSAFLVLAPGQVTLFRIPQPAPPANGPNISYSTVANSLNNLGAATGNYFPIEPTYSHGFLRNPDGTIVLLDVPGAVSISANDINDVGQVVGSFDTDLSKIGTMGFIYDAGVFTSVVVPGATSTDFVAINDAGTVAGTYLDATGLRHGFVRTGTTVFEITGPGGAPFLPVDLNDLGQVIGTFRGTGLSYIGTPQSDVPEPSSLAVLVCGLAALGVVKHHTRTVRRNTASR